MEEFEIQLQSSLEGITYFGNMWKLIEWACERSFNESTSKLVEQLKYVEWQIDILGTLSDFINLVQPCVADQVVFVLCLHKGAY